MFVPGGDILEHCSELFYIGFWGRGGHAMLTSTSDFGFDIGLDIHILLDIDL